MRKMGDQAVCAVSPECPANVRGQARKTRPVNFDSNGYQTSVVDRNGLRTTSSYSGGDLSTIRVPYNNLTTFTFD
jgi:hypothetical protein